MSARGELDQAGRRFRAAVGTRAGKRALDALNVDRGAALSLLVAEQVELYQRKGITAVVLAGYLDTVPVAVMNWPHGPVIRPLHDRRGGGWRVAVGERVPCADIKPVQRLRQVRRVFPTFAQAWVFAARLEGIDLLGDK